MTFASTDFLVAARRLMEQDRPFALVSVLRVEPPSSARPGDKALVTGDGQIDGWIGGGCAQPAVTRTVRQALRDGRPRVIRIAPIEQGHERDLGDVLEFGMACHSGGTVELFIDPVLPPARLVVIGNSPVAHALSGLAPRVGLRVSVVAHNGKAEDFPDAERIIASDEAAAVGGQITAAAFVVVATQGQRDLQGLRAALALRARKIFFVASARKAQVLRGSLVEAGQDAAAVAAIVAPAGQAMGGETPEEIALSVLTAVVALRRQGQQAPAEPIDEAQTPAAPALSPLALTSRNEPLGKGSCCGGAAAASTFLADNATPAATLRAAEH